MPELESWAIVEGFLLPLLISVIVRKDWGDDAKAITAFGVCVVFAVGTSYFKGQLDLGSPDVEKLLGNILTVLVFSIGSYKLMWKSSKIGPAIENLTG